MSGHYVSNGIRRVGLKPGETGRMDRSRPPSWRSRSDASAFGRVNLPFEAGNTDARGRHDRRSRLARRGTVARVMVSMEMGNQSGRQPPQRRQTSMSIANTRISRCAQVRHHCRSSTGFRRACRGGTPLIWAYAREQKMHVVSFDILPVHARLLRRVAYARGVAGADVGRRRSTGEDASRPRGPDQALGRRRAGSADPHA